MIWYEIQEGAHVNNYDLSGEGEIRSLSKALRLAKKCKSPYVRVDKYEGEYSADGGYDGDYMDTIYETMNGKNILVAVRS